MEAAARLDAIEISTQGEELPDPITPTPENSKQISDPPSTRGKNKPILATNCDYNEEQSRAEKKKSKRVTPALKVLTSRNKMLACQSQLNTPANDFTPFHSPADPLKLNSDGPNWHLFNRKVTDSLEKLTQLKLTDDRVSPLARESEKKVDYSKEDARV